MITNKPDRVRMTQEWILQRSETRRRFASATWVPLRAMINEDQGHDDVKRPGFRSEFFGCGSVAFPPEHAGVAESLGWSSIGIGHRVRPHAYEDGHYSPIEEYQRNDKEPIGVELVFEHPQPVVGGTKWILNPDLIVALRLVKEGNNWVRPEEDFVVVAREDLDEQGSHRLVEIKREFLVDYLAARGLSLRLSYYRQRVENVLVLQGSPYEGMQDHEEQRDGGRFELRIRDIQQIFGGSWAVFRAWRTDVDADEDAPVMGPERGGNTDFEAFEGHHGSYSGVRVEGEYWREEWIEHQGKSLRVRGDQDDRLIQFIVETDGTRMAARDLYNEDIGRWLWFDSGVVGDLLGHRGFALEWYTAETGGIRSTSGYVTHFGLNAAALITVYANDVARLEAWEQVIWAAHNVLPEGKVSSELLQAQVAAEPAATVAVEQRLFESMRALADVFRHSFGVSVFNHEIDEVEATKVVSRFASKDQASLLRLAKEVVRLFSDRLNVRELRRLAADPQKDKHGSNKLLQDLVAQKVGADNARHLLGVIVGAYDMRVGDAHPTGARIGEAIALAGIDRQLPFVKQGEQLIGNFGTAVSSISKALL